MKDSLEQVFGIRELLKIIFSFIEDTSACYLVSKKFLELSEQSTVGFEEACKRGRWIEVRRVVNNPLFFLK